MILPFTPAPRVVPSASIGGRNGRSTLMQALVAEESTNKTPVMGEEVRERAYRRMAYAVLIGAGLVVGGIIAAAAGIIWFAPAGLYAGWIAALLYTRSAGFRRAMEARGRAVNLVLAARLPYPWAYDDYLDGLANGHIVTSNYPEFRGWPVADVRQLILDQVPGAQRWVGRHWAQFQAFHRENG